MRSSMKGAALAALVVGVSACSNSNNNVEFGNGTFTLQGVVMNAITGARIGGDLKLYLVQGTDVRGPTRLNTDGDLAGEYAFAGIPAEYDYGEKMYKVVAIKSGFERFEAQVSFSVEGMDYGNGTVIIDTDHNMIGNIYLFPTGTPTPAYTIDVFYKGKPVPDATVLLDPIVTNNNKNVFAQGSALGASPGYIASLSATTDANGKASFAGKDLALGANYSVEVLPTTFTDSAGTTVQLAASVNTTQLTAGITNTELYVDMGDLTPTANTVYVTSVSNKPAGQFSASGTLTITFNAPVALVNPLGFTAVLNPGRNQADTAAGAGLLVTPTATTSAVNASLSGDGLTLTLTPNYQTAPAATDRGVSITYAESTGYVVAKDYPSGSNSSFSVFAPAIPNTVALQLADSSNVSGTVAISAP